MKTNLAPHRIRPSAFRIAALAVIVLGLAGSGSSIWCTITVTTSEGLRDAIDSLPPGSTICLQPGTYRAGLVIRNDLTIRGTRSSQVLLHAAAGEDAPALEIVPAFGDVICVTLEDLTLSGASGGEVDGYREDHGLLLARGAHVVLRNVDCTGNDGSGA